ncbi:MAG: VOC family protein [Candidatus Acidiferrales bacterium]|jgi:catechol 2,3-dioxygenase-like lactoylglutathione lyase family enzyme
MEHIIANLLQNFERGKMNRRQLIQSLALAASAASAVKAAPAGDPGETIVKATYLNHVSHPVPDYAKTRDWYKSLFGMPVDLDDGSKANLRVGESLVIIKKKVSEELAGIDHICFTIANWDEDPTVREKVSAELKRRNVQIKRESKMSIYLLDPDGLIIQIGGKDQ